MLGFATVESGDLMLTPLGQTFAEASIQARKEIFAARIRRVPIIRWIRNMINAATDHRMNWDIYQAALSLEFPPDEAERQMETAVNWGRYAELFYFDDDEDVLFLEKEPVPGGNGVAVVEAPEPAHEEEQ